jgi:hypothetical protein
MRAVIFGLLLSALAGAVAAAPGPGPVGRQTTICLDADGARHNSLCQRGTDVGDPYVCTCQGATTAVHAPVCAPGEQPPPESDAAAQARRKAVATGSLNGATVGGQRLCVAPRHQPSS